MEESLLKLVHNAHEDAVLSAIYTSDGTPVLLRKRMSAQLGQRLIQRVGKSGCEFLVERLFFTC